MPKGMYRVSLAMLLKKIGSVFNRNGFAYAPKIDVEEGPPIRLHVELPDFVEDDRPRTDCKPLSSGRTTPDCTGR